MLSSHLSRGALIKCPKIYCTVNSHLVSDTLTKPAASGKHLANVSQCFYISEYRPILRNGH